MCYKCTKKNRLKKALPHIFCAAVRCILGGFRILYFNSITSLMIPCRVYDSKVSWGAIVLICSNMVDVNVTVVDYSVTECELY